MLSKEVKAWFPGVASVMWLIGSQVLHAAPILDTSWASSWGHWPCHLALIWLEAKPSHSYESNLENGRKICMNTKVLKKHEYSLKTRNPGKSQRYTNRWEMSLIFQACKTWTSIYTSLYKKLTQNGSFLNIKL